MDKQSKNNFSRLLIKQRASDSVYFCELYLKNDHFGRPDDVFRLGHSSDVEKYKYYKFNKTKTKNKTKQKTKRALFQKDMFNSIWRYLPKRAVK